MSLMPSAPRSIGGVLDDAIRLYRKSLPSCLPLTILLVALIAVPTFWLSKQMLGVNVQSPQAVTAAMLAVFKTPGIWLGYVLLMLIYMMVHIAIIRRIHSVARGELASVGNVLAAGFALVPRVFVFSVLLILLLCIGFALLIVPGIYLLGVYQFAFIALIVDNAGIFESFSISRKLIKGHWWRSATIFTVAFIMMMVFSIIAGIVSAVFSGTGQLNTLNGLLIQQAVSSIVNVFLIPLFPSVLLAAYYDFKLRYEGSDLEARIDTLQAGN